MQAVDWNQTVIDPVTSVMKGVQLRELRDTSEYNNIVKAKALEEYARQEELRQGLSNLLNSDEELTSGKLLKYAALMDPGRASQLNLMWAQKGKEEQRQLLSDSSRVLSALNSNRPDLASQFLLERAARSRNAGKESSAKEDEALAERVKTDPKSVLAEMTLTLGSMEQGRQMLQAMEESSLLPLKSDLLRAQTDAQKALAGERDAKAQGGAAGASAYPFFSEAVANGDLDPTKFSTKAQMEAANNAIAIAKAKGENINFFKLMETTKNLGDTADSRKGANEAIESAQSALLSANNADRLALQFEKLKPVDGLLGRGGEIVKAMFGAGDAATLLEKNYMSFRANEVVKLAEKVKPVSDIDMKTFMSTMLDPNSDPKLISTYLKGAAKMARLTAKLEKAKGIWYSDNRSLGKSKSETEINGKIYKAGSTFNDVVEDIMKEVETNVPAEKTKSEPQDRFSKYIRK